MEIAIHVSSISEAALERLNDGRARNALEKNIDSGYFGDACAHGYCIRCKDPLPFRLPSWIEPSAVVEVTLDISFKVSGGYPNTFAAYANKSIRRKKAIASFLDSGGMEFVKLHIIAKSLPALHRLWQDIMCANEEGEEALKQLKWRF